MEFIIHPYEGVEIPGKGMIRFGMTREEVRRFFDAEPDEFYVTQSSTVLTDTFFQSSLQFHYQKEDILEFIVISEPQKANYNQQDLLQISYEEVNSLLSSLDSQIIANDTGIKSYKLGISIYAPYACAEDVKSNIEAISLFCKDYYSS